MKAKVYDVNGSVIKEVELPKVFEETVREDLIRRAVLAEQSKRYQPKGNYVWAGLETSAKYRGRKESYASLKNRGQARLPRTVRPKGRWGDVRKVPFAVKGRRAHPPKVEKKIVELINKKEHLKALRSAIAATTHKDIVVARGHKVDTDVPILIDESFDKLTKTKDVYTALSKIVGKDMARAKNGRKRVTTRKGGTYTPKSVLIVVKQGSPLLKSARNLPGVDVVTPDKLSVELLAPGTHPGRLTLYSVNVLDEIDNLDESVFAENN